MKLTRKRVIAARVVAIVADAIQIGLLPLFVEGLLSTLNDVLDVVVAIVLIALVGWHWSFLPAFLAEVVPFFDLVPTWTAAVFLATRDVPPGTEPAIDVASEAPAQLGDGEGPASRSSPPRQS